MSYDYETEKKELFTDDGQRSFLKIREAQRIAIATACGWTITQINESGMEDIAILPPGVSVKDEGAVWKYAGIDLPDYLNDLNAMHEAEMLHFDALVKGQHWLQLNEVIGFAKGMQVGHWHASAAQRAESFLRTLNLWQP